MGELTPLRIDLAGRRCMVTGAAGGIGRSIVMTLIRCNASVIAVDCSAPALAELETFVAQAGGVVETRLLDITVRNPHLIIISLTESSRILT